MTYQHPPVSPPQPPPAYHLGQPVPPPRKKSSLGLVIGIVVAVFAVLCVGGGILATLAGDPDKTTNATANDTAANGPTENGTTANGTTENDTAGDGTASGEEAEPKAYRVGQAVRGGDFEFVVHGTKCGIAQVGNEYLNRKAQGTFCRVDLTAKNVTKKSQLFHADSTVSAQDSSGREFSADGEAGIYGNKDGAGFLDEINPGNQVRAFVYFDVPKGAKLKTITFDAGLFTLAEDAVVTL